MPSRVSISLDNLFPRFLVVKYNNSYISHRLRPLLDSMGTTLSRVHSPTETSIDVAGQGRAYLNARASHRIKGGLAS